MTKTKTKQPTIFTCKYCNNIFYRFVYPSATNKCKFYYCSPKCRNKARAIPAIPCPICGNMFSPKINDIGHTRKKYCSKKCVGVAKRSIDYPIYERRRNHKTLSREEYRIRVHESARTYMINNNPMFKQETKDKVSKYWNEHPDEKAKVMEKLMEGHQRVQKNKPNKLEIKLFGYLDQLNVKYEPYHLIKPKFIVDALVENNIIIQADGDYWHGHPRFTKPTERQIAQQKRDKAQDKYLTACGYKVIRIWESDMSLDIVASRLGIQTILH